MTAGLRVILSPLLRSLEVFEFIFIIAAERATALRPLCLLSSGGRASLVGIDSGPKRGCSGCALQVVRSVRGWRLLLDRRLVRFYICPGSRIASLCRVMLVPASSNCSYLVAYCVDSTRRTRRTATATMKTLATMKTAAATATMRNGMSCASYS